jgi:hypothetical protein
MIRKSDPVPVFTNAPNPAAEEAFAELFAKPNFFAVRGHAFMPDDYHAGIATYLDDDGQECIEFSVAHEDARPLAHAQELLDGYSNILAAFSSLRRTVSRADLEYDLTIGKSNVREAGMRMLAAATAFSADDGLSSSVNLMVPKAIAIDIPEKNNANLRKIASTPEGLASIAKYQADFTRRTNDPEEVEQAKQNMLNGDPAPSENYGMFIGTRLLPEVVAARRIANSHPAIDGFFDLPRGKRKKELREEARRAN